MNGDWRNSSLVAEQVEKILEQLSLEDKIRLVSGQFILGSTDKPPSGLPLFNMADGPAGIRTSPEATTATGSTALPAPIALAATWSTELATKYGNLLGLEAKLTGHNVLLGPAIDIARAPLAGRTFESFGEDPLLQSRMVVPEVQAIQAHGVQASLKHFIVNNQEHDRNSINVRVDHRSLFEIYLPPFEAAIRLGGVASVMASYNRVNGLFACDNHHILSKILRHQLGFRGWVVSDFLANHSTAKSANAGLDWELTMPHASQWRSHLLEAVKNAEVSLETLNEMVRRILRPTIGLGMLESGFEQLILSHDHAAIALEIAEQSMVLLKNANYLLPLSTEQIKSIAIIGADADTVAAAGGGSALVQPLREISVLDGIKTRVGSSIKVSYAAGTDAIGAGVLLHGDNCIPSSVFKQADGRQGLLAQYWNNLESTGEPVITRIEPNVEFIRGFFDFPGFQISVASHHLESFPMAVEPIFSACWTGLIKPPMTGEYALSITTAGRAKLYVNEQPILEVQSQILLHAGSQHWDGSGAAFQSQTMQLNAGQEYAIRLEYASDFPELCMLYGAQLRLGWQPPKGTLTPKMQQAVDLARISDVAVVVVRTFESEGLDRPNLQLPSGQNELIEAVSRVNPKTIVVLMTGSSVDASRWESTVPAILEAWYAGQEQGAAVARILFGDVVPSGKLPITFPHSQDQMPPLEYPGVNGHITYAEGLNIGYRGYEKHNIEPLYPFGFGLSYTSFSYSNLEILQDKLITIQFELENTGAYTGIEIAQLYLEMPDNQAPKKLAGFARVLLQPQEKQTVCIYLDADSLERPFSIWDDGWQRVFGQYRVLVGASSRDILLETTFEMNP